MTSTPRRLQRGFARLAHILRAAVDRARSGADCGDEAELRGEHDFLTAIADRLADLLLGIAIHISRVEKRDAEIECAVEQGDGVIIAIGTARIRVGDADAHAAQANSGYIRAVLA